MEMLELLTVQPLTPADKEEFLTLSRAFYQSDAVLHEIDESCHQNAFEEMMRSDVYLLGYLLKCDGKTAGYAVLNKMFMREVGGHVVWIEELYVIPEFQGKGLGRAFFAWLEEHIPAVRYRLEAEPDNRRAMALYQRLGYEVLPYVQMIKDVDKQL